MTPPDGRDRGLATVRKATLWLAGGALLAVGGTAAILGRPTSAAAGSTQSTTGESVDGSAANGATTTTLPRAGASTTTTQPRSGATATTTPRSSTTTVPSTPAPRTSRRRPSVSSGGS